MDASGYALGDVLHKDHGRELQPIAHCVVRMQAPERNLAPTLYTLTNLHFLQSCGFDSIFVVVDRLTLLWLLCLHSFL
jgi:hypothetical protein